MARVASLYRLRRYLTLTPILVVAGLTGMSTGCFSGGGGGLPSWAKWDDACPAWSPNGKQIAFASNRAAVEASVKVRAASREWGYHYDLFVMNGDGTGVRRLTYLGRTRSVDDSAPEWSEQGRMILFAVTTPLELVYRNEVGPASQRGAAYHVNLKGRPTIQRVPRTALGPPRHPNPGNYAQYECKTKSPDGTKIAFYRPISNDLGAGGGIAGRVGFICVMNPDGTGKHRLTQPPNGKPISRPIECPHTAP